MLKSLERKDEDSEPKDSIGNVNHFTFPILSKGNGSAGQKLSRIQLSGSRKNQSQAAADVAFGMW